MADHQFDGLAKALASQTSRRQALKVFGAAALGGLFASSRLTRAAPVDRCIEAECRASAANACETCTCGNQPPGSQGQGTQECICTPVTCPPGRTCCPSGKFEGQCRRGACPG